MPSLETLTQADIKQVVNKKSLTRARSYVAGIQQATRNGRSLHAKVGKNRMYDVEIDVLTTGIHAACSCPYDWGGYCKHIGALLLKWREQPDSFVITAVNSVDTSGIIDTFTIKAPETAVPAQKPFWLQLPYQIRRKNDDEDLRLWLNEYKVKELRQIAKQQGWPLKGTRKAELVQQIMDQLLQASSIHRNLISLDDEHRQVLDAMSLLYPGILFEHEMITKLAKYWGKLTKYKNAGPYSYHLCRAGLAIPGEADQVHWRHVDFIPNNVIRILPPLLTERISAATLSDETNSSITKGQPRPFLQRIQQLLNRLAQTPPPLRQPMPRPRLEKFHDFLKEWDYIPEEIQDTQAQNKFQNNKDFSLTVPPPQPMLPDAVIQLLTPFAGSEIELNFMVHLLLAAGLLLPGTPVTVWEENNIQFLRHSAAEQWAILVRAYFTMITWNELWLVLAKRPSLQLKRSHQSYYYATTPEAFYSLLAVMRNQVFQVLAALPDDTWFTPRDLSDLLQIIWPRFDSQSWALQHYHSKIQPNWFLADNGRFLDTANNKADWNKAQGEFIQQIIQGPLHWLGLADISLEYGRLTAFRLHGLRDLYHDRVESIPLGEAPETAVSQQTTSSTPPTEAITVQDTTIIVQPTAVSAQAHNYLDSIAILQEAGQNQFVYQLSAAAVHQAFENGQTLTDIHNGWQKWITIPIPPAIQEQLQAWDTAYGQVRLYEDVTVIEFSDEYALTEMKATTSLKKHLISEISPTLVIIPTKTADLLAAELEKAGYMPKITDTV